MFEKFIADLKAKSQDEEKLVPIDTQRIVVSQANALLLDKLKSIDSMSEKEVYNILSNSYSIILSEFFRSKNKEYRFLLSSPKFIYILTQITNEVTFTHDEKVQCNRFIYEYTVYNNEDKYIRTLLLLLGEAVNKPIVRKLLGCDLDDELAIFLAVTNKSSFKEETVIRRLNFTIATSGLELMTLQRIINIYEALFTRVKKLFISTMFDTNIQTNEDAWVTKDIFDTNTNITKANLLILESMEPIEITKVLLSYAEEFATVYGYNYKAVRTSLHHLPPDFIKTPIIVKQLEGDGILIP